jgi:hypothetical protein
MPSIRIGLSTDFNLTNELVGINTTVPSVRLDVRGQILSENTAGGTGVSTLTTYDGFLDAQQRVTSNISIAQTTKGNLNSLSGEIILDEEVTVTDGTPLTGGRLDSLTVTGAFDLPHGGTASRETTPEKGSTRFNSDLGQLEFYTGTEWRTTLSYDGSGRGKAYYVGGIDASTSIKNISYVYIQTLGNTQNFGELTTAMGRNAGCSSEIRGLSGGGTPSAGNVIEYFTLSTSGNSADFGDLTGAGRNRFDALSSSTRGIFCGGYASPTNTNIMDYVQISTIGNALDFGDLSAVTQFSGACANSTRGIIGGGESGPASISTIQYITISSTGNSIFFGNLSGRHSEVASCSNSIRGVFAGGVLPSPGPRVNNIDYITIATLGNAVDFGDLTSAKSGMSGTGDRTRGIFFGNQPGPAGANTIDYITYATTGNAQDFGDFDFVGSTQRRFGAAVSDSHGGLGGF